MRRALCQTRIRHAEIGKDGKIWGNPEGRGYDPFDLYSRGVAPHLAFAAVKDIKKWHEDYGPLFADGSRWTVSHFQSAQRRFLALLNLWKALKRGRKNLRDFFLEATRETGIVVLSQYRTVLGENPAWEVEASGNWGLGEKLERTSEKARPTITIGGKNPFDAAEEFVRSAQLEELKRAAEELLKWALVLRVQGVQPDFAEEAGFHPTYTVRDLLQAFYLMLYFDVTGRKTIAQCAECGQFFYPTAKRVRFCSGDCARRHRQRRYWKRKGKFRRKNRIRHAARTSNVEES